MLNTASVGCSAKEYLTDLVKTTSEKETKEMLIRYIRTGKCVIANQQFEADIIDVDGDYFHISVVPKNNDSPFADGKWDMWVLEGSVNIIVIKIKGQDI